MEAPMSSSLGAMGPLLRKLDGLLAPDGRKLPKLLKSRIQNLKMDLLEDIVNPFEELSEEKNPDLTTEYWLTEVRELSYDIEDSINEMIPATVHTDAAAATRSGANARWRRVGSSKIAGLPRMPKRSTRIDKVARLRMDLVWEAIDRHERYVQRQEDDDSSRSTTFVSSGDTSIADRTTPLLSTAGPEMGIGSVSKRQEMLQQRDDTIASANHPSIIWQHEFQSPTPCRETSNLVGLDDSRMELMNRIKYEKKKDLKVVSIVGPGGIGKSTLAMELYHEHGKQFRCWAYVRASQKPNVRKLLWDVLAQIQRHQRPSRACNLQSLIDNISSHLQDKRYFIVIDDLWQTTIWDIIVKAFPESNNCSRILITTEMESVALECTGYQSDYIIKMKPLGNVDSTKLFTNIVFGSQRQQNHKEMDKSSYEVTRKSGGLPLATTSVAGLARFSASQQTKVGTWSHIHNFLSTTFSSSGSKEMMKETLHFCYNELPQHLKTCLLYLSMYPEGYVISKADLMKQWIAEGFICTTQGKDKEEIAERYFNELINCRLIHASCIKYIDEVISCTVHHMVLDMIKCKSKEANFTTVTDYPHIAPGLSTKVRRLSLQLSSAKHVWKPATITMPHVRSLAFFGLLECLPLVASFKLKFIRVLILEIWGEDNGCTNLDLTRICVFLQLRYLKITSDVTVQLPDEIAGLQHLETLEVDARVSSVPLDIIDLPRLSQLRIKDEINLPDGIGGIRSLHTLQYFDLAQNSEKNVQSLGKLSNLRDLHLTCSTAASKEHLKSNLDALSSSLGNLGVLCSLTLAPGASGAGRVPLEGPIIMSSSSLPLSIQKLKLLPAICIFSRLPEWMGGLPKLRILKFAVRELLRNDIDHLSQLPALAVLCLHVRVARVGTVIIERGSFPALRYFQFRSTALSMAFRAGAMPQLEILKLGFKAQRGKQYGRMLGGIEHLINLQEITGEIAIASGAGETDWRAAQSAFDIAIEHSTRKWNAASEHPSFPRVRVKLVDWTVAEEAFANQDEERSGCLVTATNRDPAACDRLPFPLDLLPCVISFVSPLDACRCLSVCKAFHAEASRDQVWDRFIPTDYRLSILSRANDPVDLDFASTKKELFTILSEQHILIDQGNMSFWLDRATGTKSYMLAAKSLNITWGDTPQYWRWIAHPDSRFEEVAELIDVCWLNIIATIDCRELSPDTKYTAYLVFNLTDRSYGLDSPTQEACVTIAGAVSARHTVSLYPHARQHRSRVASSPYYWPQHHWGDEVEEEDEEDEETEEEEGDEEEDYIEADEDVDDEEEDEQDDDIGVEEDEFEEMEYEEDNIEVEADEDVDDEEEDDIEVEEDECEEMEDEEDDVVVEDDCEEMEDEEDDIEVEEEAEVDDEGVGGGENEARCMQEMLRGVRGSNELLDLHEQEQEKEVVRYPRARDDGWMEVEMGEFYIENLDDGAVEIRLKEHESLNWKSGLILEGVEIRPVIRSGKQASAC